MLVEVAGMKCPNCNRDVKVKQKWHFNQTRMEIHCKCGRHVASEWVYRGEALPTREEMKRRWES